jgi:hypothetical protein
LICVKVIGARDVRLGQKRTYRDVLAIRCYPKADIPSRTFTDKNGLRELVEQSSIGETAANYVNWRLTIGFVFLIWGDLSWQLYLPFVISLRHRLLNWQPVALKRTIDDLARNYRAFCACI